MGCIIPIALRNLAFCGFGVHSMAGGSAHDHDRPPWFCGTMVADRADRIADPVADFAGDPTCADPPTLSRRGVAVGPAR